jgi:hemerythrin-like domain-containing protein
MSAEYDKLLLIAGMLEGESEEHDEFALALRQIAMSYRRLERFADETVADAYEQAEAAEQAANINLHAALEEASYEVALERTDSQAIAIQCEVVTKLQALRKEWSLSHGR